MSGAVVAPSPTHAASEADEGGGWPVTVTFGGGVRSGCLHISARLADDADPDRGFVITKMEYLEPPALSLRQLATEARLTCRQAFRRLCRRLPGFSA